MTQNVIFPDAVWARLATLAEKREMRIADLLVDAAKYLLNGTLPEPEPCRLKHVKPKTDIKGRPPQVAWRDPDVEARIRGLHEAHRSCAEIAREFGVSWSAMRTAHERLGIPLTRTPKTEGASMSGAQRPPAPNLSPVQMLRVIEFEHAGTDTFEEADA